MLLRRTVDRGMRFRTCWRLKQATHSRRLLSNEIFEAHRQDGYQADQHKDTTSHFQHNCACLPRRRRTFVHVVHTMVKAAEISDFWYPRYVVHAVSVYLIIPNGGFISKETERELYRTARVMLLRFKCLRTIANLPTFSFLI